MRRAIFAAAFDSQLKWCAKIREELETRGVSCRIVVPNIRSALSDQQIVDAGVSRVERLTWQEMMHVAFSSDIFISALSGPSTKRIAIELRTRSQESGMRHPVLVSGWVGVIIEKLVAGYLDRCACDVVAVNSQEDWDRFHVAADHLKIPTENMVLSGLPFVPNVIAPQRSGPIKTVLFADQPTVPESAWERLYLYRRLIDYAKAHPDRRVMLKPRHRPGEDTFHQMEHHPEDLLKNDTFPPNFEISYEPISKVISSIDLMLTMSSTAALEAIADGCRVGFVLDPGVHEKYGNQVFLNSGLLRTFDALIADDIGTPSQAWVEAFFPRLQETPAKIIVDRAMTLIEADGRPSEAVWATSYFEGACRFHYAGDPLRSDIKRMNITTDKFQKRLNGYGPLRRTVVKWGDRLLPDAIAKPVDRVLKRIGVL